MVYIKGSDSLYILNLLSPFLTGHKACSFANHYVDVSCTFTQWQNNSTLYCSLEFPYNTTQTVWLACRYFSSLWRIYPQTSYDPMFMYLIIYKMMLYTTIVLFMHLLYTMHILIQYTFFLQYFT